MKSNWQTVAVGVPDLQIISSIPLELVFLSGYVKEVYT